MPGSGCDLVYQVRGSGFGLASASAKLGLVTSPLVASRLAESSVLRMGCFFTLLWAAAAVALLLLTCTRRSSACRYWTMQPASRLLS